MLNTETIVHPKLAHVGLLTGNLPRLVDWYQKVLGMRSIHASKNPMDAPAGSPPALINAAFISNDEMSHRFAVVEVPGLTADPERSKHHRLQHVAFEFGTLFVVTKCGAHVFLPGIGGLRWLAAGLWR